MPAVSHLPLPRWAAKTVARRDLGTCQSRYARTGLQREAWAVCLKPLPQNQRDFDFRSISASFSKLSWWKQTWILMGTLFSWLSYFLLMSVADAGLCLCEHTQACVWRPDIDFECLPSFFSTLIFGAGCCSWAWCSSAWLSCVASERETCLSLLLQSHAQRSIVSSGCWWSQLRSPCCHSRCFTHWAISRVPQLTINY